MGWILGRGESVCAPPFWRSAIESWGREGSGRDGGRDSRLRGTQISIVGFNSGKYDINVIKPYLFQYFVNTHPLEPPFVIKRDNSFLCITSPCKSLKFLDLSNYLSPGTSFAAFLKCFGAKDMKGKFLFKWFTSKNKLNQTYLPFKDDICSLKERILLMRNIRTSRPYG